MKECGYEERMFDKKFSETVSVFPTSSQPWDTYLSNDVRKLKVNSVLFFVVSS